MSSHVRGDTYSALGHVKLAAAVSGDIDIAFSDSVDIDLTPFSSGLPPRAFAIFSSGAIKMTTASGKIDTYADGELIKGYMYPEAIKRIWATGTTVTLVRIYF